MTRENKMKAIEILSNTLCTIEMQAVIDGRVHEEFLAVTDCCHNSIKKLMENGYIVSLQEGKLIVDKI